VIHSRILASSFNAENVANGSDYANYGLIAAGVRADRAEIAVADHHTPTAVVDVCSEAANRTGELADLFGGAPKQVESKPQSTAGTYSRKRTYRLYSILKDL
jgi:hypothetical protein